MITEIINVNESIIWLVIDQLYTYSSDKEFIETKDEYLCFFSLTQPNAFIYGELFRDRNNHPILFKSKDLAIEYAKTEFQKRLK